MQQKALIAPGLIERARAVCQDADGEFKPLALMDAHHAHHVCRFGDGGRRGELRLLLLKPVDKADESRQPLMACCLILCRVGEQKLQVGGALFGSAHRLHEGWIAGFLIDAAQKRFGRQRCAQAPQEGEL